MFSDKQFGLSGGLIAVAKVIMEAKQNDKVKDDIDAKKMKGGKTKVDLNPETDDKSHDSDYMNKKSMKEGKEHTIPKTEKEKKLAALAHPKDKITHKDVLVGRGAVKEDDLDEKITPSELKAQLKANSRARALAAAAAAAANNPKDDLERRSAFRAQWNKQFGNKTPQLKAKAAANKPKDDLDEKITSKPEMPKRKLDWEKIKAVRAARKVAKSARHGDTSHLPKGFSSTFHKEDVELTDEELERLEIIAQSLDEAKPTIVSAPIRGANQDQSGFGTKGSTADYTISDEKKKEEPPFDGPYKKSDEKTPARSHLKSLVKKAQTGLPTKEETELDEVIKIGTKVKMHAPGKDYHDQVGHVGEIKHGLFKGAEKSYTVDYGDERKKSVQLDKANVKMHKEETDLDEAKRGRPKNNPEPGEDEDEHEHVIMQLRKVVSTHGALPVKHLDGMSTKISPQLAQHALNKHNVMKTAAEKQDYEQKLHKSHDSMKSALGQ